MWIFERRIVIAERIRNLERAFEELSIPGSGLGIFIDEATEDLVHRVDAAKGCRFGQLAISLGSKVFVERSVNVLGTFMV